MSAETMPNSARTADSMGVVEEAFGLVVDVCCRYLPPLGQALDVRGHDQMLVLEVRQHQRAS